MASAGDHRPVRAHATAQRLEDFDGPALEWTVEGDDVDEVLAAVRAAVPQGWSFQVEVES